MSKLNAHKKFFNLLLFLAFNLGVYSMANGQFCKQLILGYGKEPTETLGYSIIDFSSDTIRLIGPIKGNGYYIGLNSSIACDDIGNIKLITNNCSVLNSTGSTMLNGDTLNPGATHNDYCPRFYPGLFQNIFVKDRTDKKKTLLFHKNSIVTDSLTLASTELRLSVISEENAIHRLVKQESLRTGEAHSNMIAAIPHAEINGWWVLELKAGNTNEWLKYEIHADSLVNTSSQLIGPKITEVNSDYSQIIISPDKTKIALFAEHEGLFVYEFDTSTGALKFFNKFEGDWMEQSDSILVDGYCFSPNSRLLYVTNTIQLLQFNLEDNNTAPNIISTYEGLRDPINGFPSVYGDMMIGPDCRIYVATRAAGSTIHVIHKPNLVGANCTFEQQAIKLKTQYPHQLPNIDLWSPSDGSMQCDSTIHLLTSTPDRMYTMKLGIFPNPADDEIEIQGWQDGTKTNIYNLSGIPQMTGVSRQVNISALKSGLYVVHIKQQGNYYRYKLIKR